MTFYAPAFDKLGQDYKALIKRKEEIEGSNLPDVEKIRLVSEVEHDLMEMAPQLNRVSEAIDEMIMMDTFGGAQ